MCSCIPSRIRWRSWRSQSYWNRMRASRLACDAASVSSGSITWSSWMILASTARSASASAKANRAGSAVASRPNNSNWVICIDVLPVLRVRRRMGDRERTSYGKSNQRVWGFSVSLRLLINIRRVEYWL